MRNVARVLVPDGPEPAVTASRRRRVGVAAIALTVTTMVSGCGGDADRFGTIASDIQGCRLRLSETTESRTTSWAGATKVRGVVCGPASISDGMLLTVAQYASPEEAATAARRLARRRLLCVVDDTVVESWMYPYDAFDDKRADRQARTWARLFCARVEGRSTGHWNAWEYSS